MYLEEMKQSLLDSLKDLTSREAEAVVLGEGLDVMVVENGDAIAAVAMPQTVVLWLDSTGLVANATAGDPLELTG